MSDKNGIVGALARFAELPARYFYAVAFVAIALLVIGQPRWSAVFGFTDLPPYYRLGLTAIALLSLTFGSLKGISHLGRRRAFRAARDARDDQRASALRSLSPAEMFVLVFFAMRGERTFYAQVNHPVLHGLVAKGLLEQASGIGSAPAWPFVMTDDTWEFVTAMLEDKRVAEHTLDQLREVDQKELLRRLDPFTRSLYD